MIDKTYLSIMKGLSGAFGKPTKAAQVTPIVEEEELDSDIFDEDECPHGGDNTDCESCSYYPDYHWDKDLQDCVTNLESYENHLANEADLAYEEAILNREEDNDGT